MSATSIKRLDVGRSCGLARNRQIPRNIFSGMDPKYRLSVIARYAGDAPAALIVFLDLNLHTDFAVRGRPRLQVADTDRDRAPQSIDMPPLAQSELQCHTLGLLGAGFSARQAGPRCGIEVRSGRG